MTIELKQYATTNGLRPALVKAGHKYLSVLYMEAVTSSGKLTVRKVPKTEQRYMCELHHKRRPYPLKRALKTFRKFGNEHGITKGAKKLLREASQQ